jgi:hypothetical protein
LSAEPFRASIGGPYVSGVLLPGPLLAVALFSELGLNPGASLGLSYVRPGSTQRQLSVSLFGGPKVAGYIHPGSHARILAQLEGGARLTVWGLDAEIVLGGGGTWMARAAPTYTLVDGELKRKRFAGQLGLMPTAAIGIGSGLPRRDHLRWFLRPTLLLQTPYNDSIAPFAVLEIGLREAG